MRPAVDATLGDGRYRLEQRLGAGGMASVWLAVDQRLGRPVAVKIVADTLAGDEHWLRRFRREARAAARLSHAGVVPVFDYGVEDERPYLVMEYVPGGTLAHRLRDAGASAPPAHRLARELLEALGAVHAAGILHRDIKPANLLLDEHDHVRLTDFGIAQPQDATSLTRTGMVVGTLRYLAPEVAAGQPATVQSDLFSAGVVIREAAGSGAAPPLADVIASLTAEDPGDRPVSTAAALAQLGSGADATTATRTRRADATAATRTRRAQPATPPLRAESATRPRRAVPATRPRRAESTTRPLLAESATRKRRLPTLLAAAAAVVVVAVVVVIIVASGAGSPKTPAAPTPAPAQAPVAQQIQALQRIVEGASR
jgi:eukaryotic-like serine/threonine-protein kinase